MSSMAMGIRASLRTAQEVGLATPGPLRAVVGDSAGRAADPSRPGGLPTQEATSAARYLEQVASWIPTEALVVFTTMSLAFPEWFFEQDGGRNELIVGGFCLLISGGLAFASSWGAHGRREVVGTSRLFTSATVAGASVVATLVYWAALPRTAPVADWGWANEWVFFAVMLLATMMPVIARWLKIEPITSGPAKPVPAPAPAAGAAEPASQDPGQDRGPVAEAAPPASSPPERRGQG